MLPRRKAPAARVFARLALTAFLASSIAACGFQGGLFADRPESGQTTPPGRSPADDGYRAEVAPLWEAKGEHAREWTIHAFDTIERHGSALMLGSKDVTSFCPAFFSLSPTQKISFWVHLVSAMVRFESNFDPTARMHETTLGIDAITGEPVYSEGLLQLSYQDVRSYPFCNEFDWSADSRLSRTDPRKTILDPLKNLTCGIRILNRQVERKDLIAFRSGQYWAVLIPDGKYTRVSRIQELTSSIHFCRN
jgi:predicted small lipoprotein YifL